MPVYKDETKKKNKFWYEFEIGKDPLTGKRKKIRKKGFETEKEAKAAMVKAMNEVNEGKYIEPSKLKLFDYMLSKWIPVKKLGKQTKENYIGYIKNHVQGTLLGNEELSKLSVTGIQNFITHLEAKKVRGKNLEPNTIHKIYSIVNTALNDAVTMKLISENPAKSIINKPLEVKTEKTVWNEDQIRLFVQQTEDKSRYSLVFRFALMTGLRQGEVLGLKWKNVDFKNNMIYVTETLSHDGKEIKKGAKTKTSVRGVKIDEKTKRELLKQYNLIQFEKNQLKTLYKDNDLVFCTSKGTPCTPRNLMRAFYTLLNECGDIPRLTFHELRHTQATILLKKNVHPKIVSERMGHSSIKITMDTYSHLLPDMQDVAAQSLESII